MNTAKLANIVESILFVSGNEVGEKDITEKLSVTQLELNKAISILKEKYTINYWNGKSYIQKNMRYCWKAQGELASRLLRRPLQKMNIDLIL